MTSTTAAYGQYRWKKSGCVLVTRSGHWTFSDMVCRNEPATSLRKCYHNQMQLATCIESNGTSGFKQSQEKLGVRMANHRDLHELTRLEVEKVCHGMQPSLRAVQHFCNTQSAPCAGKLITHLHKTKISVCKPRTLRSMRATHSTKSTRPRQKGSAGRMQSWLQNAASKTRWHRANREYEQDANASLWREIARHYGKYKSGARRARSWHTFPANQVDTQTAYMRLVCPTTQ